MAENVVKTLTIRGVDETKPAVDGLNKTAAAYDNASKAAAANATVMDTTAKRQLSLADSVAKAERQFNSALRAQQDFEKVQRQMNAAVAQNPALQDRANAVLALAAERYGQASAASKAFAAATSGVSGQLIALSAGAGPVGVFLSALGPWGIAAAVGIGALEKAFSAASDAAHALAEKAQELRRFSEITGLTTAQVQALRSEASRFGVTSDEAQNAIQQFTARFNDLRIGQGELLTQIRRVNPALADQMASATNAGDALTLFGQALLKVDDIFQRNALVKAATGRGGLANAQFLTGLNVDEVTKSYVEAGKGLGDNLIKKTAQLKIEIEKTSAAAKTAVASIFSQQALEAELEYQKGWLEIAKAAKNFSISGDLRFLLERSELGRILGIQAPLIVPPRLTGPEVLAPLAGGAGGRSSGAADNTDASRRQSGATAEFQLATLQKQIAAMGDAATFAQKLDAAQKQLAISGREAGLSAEQMAKAEQVLKGSFALQQIQATVSALGSVATPTEQYAARLAALSQELARGAISQQTFNRAAAGLKQEFALQALQEMVSTLGAAATPAEQLKVRFAELEQRLASGRITLETFNRSIADFQREQDVAKLRDNIAALGGAATATEQYRVRVAELQLQLDRGRISQEAFNRGVQDANPVMRDLKDISKDFITTAARGFLDAKAGADSLSKSFENLALKLADKSLEQFMSGDWEKAAVTAIMAVVSALISLVSHTNDLKGTIDTLDRLNQLRLRSVNALNDASTLAGRLAIFDASALLEQVDEARKGGALMTALIQVQSQERLKIISDFNKQAIAQEQQLADERLSRIQTAQDRIFAAANDNTTLEGQLAAQARQFERERLDETKAGGEAMTDVLAAQQAEELALRKSFNDKAIEETKRAEQERLDAINGAAKSIVDYLNGLTSGPQSTLSPTAVLSNAQAAYNANYGLALGGNLDAQNKFVSLADNLEKAARAVFASGQGYQDIRNQIINQGLALPAVQNATDPVVAELRNTIAAIQATTLAVQAGTATQALDATLSGVIKAAIDAGNAQAVAAVLIPKFDQLDTTADGALNFAEFVAGLGPQYANVTKDPTTSALLTNAQLRASSLGVTGPLTQAQIQSLGLSTEQGNLLNMFNSIAGGDGLIAKTDLIKTATQDTKGAVDGGNAINAGIWQAETTTHQILDGIRSLDTTQNNTLAIARTQLELLNQNLTITGGTVQAGGVGGLTNNPGGVNTLITSNNNLLTALNKIVISTWATAFNTSQMIQQFGGSPYAWVLGARAGGGWINGAGGPHDDRAGLFALSNREFVVNADATRALTSQFGAGIMDTINAGRVPAVPVPVPSFSGANDNSELRALRQEVAELRKDLAKALGRDGAIALTTAAGAKHVRDGVDATTEATTRAGKDVASATRMSKRDKRAA